MPEPIEYNPNILGFLADRGPVVMSLKDAMTIYGRLPSDFHLLPPKAGRQNKKGLNLALGRLITRKLKSRKNHLKKTVHDFFRQWHRDYENEFGIRIEPFFNLNPPARIRTVIDMNRETLADLSRFDLRTFLEDRQLIRKDVLNSIEDHHLSATAERILTRKLHQTDPQEKTLAIRRSLERIKAGRIIRNLERHTALDVCNADSSILTVYADEIARGLSELSDHVLLDGIEELDCVRGHDVEFEFAPRDLSYLMLGKETGDCTSDKSCLQADRTIENIYWTVFPWILDRNYQILKVYYQGLFLMKVHLLPLFIILENGKGQMALAVDAVETVRAFRDDINGYGKDDLLEKKEYIFGQVIDKIKTIGTRMGIDHIYAEKFSNTGWVRKQFETFPEIFLHVDDIIKLDELEDVFCLAQEICANTGEPAINEIFMEVQMKNTSLLPRISERNAGVKPFAIIKGRSEDGMLMKKVVGI